MSARQFAPRLLTSRLGGVLLLCAALLSAGCASVPSSGTVSAASAGAATTGDPWENWNRKVYGFNEGLDRAIIKPAAEAYEAVLPRLVRLGVSNVLGNIGDVWSTANHFLQGKMQVGLEMGMRVMTNSLFGLGGLLDPASEMGLTRRSEDFGQTLGRWGLVSGPYLVLPLLGPSTLRDAAGFLVDRQAATSTLVSGDAAKYSITALELVSVRAELLPATKLLEQVALDKYSFVRDGFLARRRDALFDGAPPLDPANADPGDSAPPPAKPAAAPTARPAAGPASTSKIPAKPAPRTTP